MDAPALRSGEVVLRSGAANHRRGLEAVGGKLFLTNHRLIFVSHGLNIQSGPAYFELSAIVGAGRSGVLRNWLTVRFSDGNAKFAVFRPSLWIRAIEAARQRPE